MLGACAAEMKNDLAVRSGNDSFALIAKCQPIGPQRRAKGWITGAAFAPSY
jgi:hypothetical protein